MICPYCKETIQDEALKCRYCGSSVNPGTFFEMNDNSISPDEIRVFLGTNSHYYLQQFSKFKRLGVDKFAPTWNWSCFGFTWLWFLYRKMYLNSLITFVVFCVPGVNIILHIVAGVVGNYLFYNHMKDRILEIRTIHKSSQNMDSVLLEVGGVHKWVITAGIVLSIISMLLMFFFFAVIMASFGNFSGVVI